jgi:hypothetical protein
LWRPALVAFKLLDKMIPFVDIRKVPSPIHAGFRGIPHQVDTERRVLHVARLKGGLSTAQPLRGDELRVISAWLKKTCQGETDRQGVFCKRAAQPVAPLDRQLALAKIQRRSTSLPLLVHPTPQCEVTHNAGSSNPVRPI